MRWVFLDPPPLIPLQSLSGVWVFFWCIDSCWLWICPKKTEESYVFQKNRFWWTMENWPKKTRMPYKSHGMFMQYSQPQASIVTSPNVKKNTFKQFTLCKCTGWANLPLKIAELGHLILFWCFKCPAIDLQKNKEHEGPKKLNMLTLTSLIHPIETPDPPGGIKTHGFWHAMTSQGFLRQRK